MNDCFKPAVNGIGWEVQHLTAHGWVACTDPFPSRKDALAALDDLYRRDAEYRVYESLEGY